MALFKRRNPDQNAAVSQVEFQPEPNRSWLALFLYFLAAVLIALILVFGGRWVYRKVTNDSSKPAPTVQPTPSPQPSAPPPAPTTAPTPPPAAPSGGQGASPPAPAPSPAPSVSPAPPTTPGRGQLPSNGPGSVAALFVGTTLAAAGLHYFISSRRKSRINL